MIEFLNAADYPYIEPEKLGVFLDELGLTDEKKRKESYNGAKLLGLSLYQQMEVIEYGNFRITRR